MLSESCGAAPPPMLRYREESGPDATGLQPTRLLLQRKSDLEWN
jgi:hypothetical protein